MVQAINIKYTHLDYCKYMNFVAHSLTAQWLFSTDELVVIKYL